LQKVAKIWELVLKKKYGKEGFQRLWTAGIEEVEGNGEGEYHQVK
jgi:hypothetical protein